MKKSSKSVKQVKKYHKKFGDNVRKAMVVTLEEEGVVDSVSVVPAWKFLLGERGCSNRPPAKSRRHLIRA